MSEERGPRHGRPRVGEETLARIDDLADGWHKPDAPAPPAPKASPAAEKRPSRPPPPPGAGRAAKRSRPPPPPPPGRARPKPSSAPPPLPPRASGRHRLSEPTSTPATVMTQSPTSGEIDDSSAGSKGAPASDLEGPSLFSAAFAAAASAPSLPAIEGSPPPARRENDADDEDPTLIPTGDEEPVRPTRATGPLPVPPSLPRRSGLWGDMRYVFTVALGKRRLRRELEDTEAEIEAEKRSRDKQLVELARLAIADLEVETPVVEEARERLVALEEARAKKAGAAAAVEEAIGAIKRERDEVKEEREQRVAELEGEIAGLEGEIEPLEKKRAAINRRIRKFKDQLEELDGRIAAREAALAAADATASVEIEAELASLTGEREAMAGDEPALASELAEIEPQLRELKAKKGDLKKAASDLRRREDESVVRSAERIAAAQAHKLVVDRAAADMTRDQNELLRELGLALYDHPPVSIRSLTVPLETRIQVLDRLKARAVGIKDQLASVEALPLVRGAFYWLVILAALGAVAYLVLLG